MAIPVETWLTKAQVDTILTAKGPELDDLQLRGFVLQGDLDSGMLRFTQPYGERKRIVQEAGFGELTPIVKRTQAQRTESLLKSWIKDCLAAGRVPGLTDPEMKEIVGASWREGRGMTAEQVKTVAEHFLQKAAKENAAAEHKNYWKQSA